MPIGQAMVGMPAGALTGVGLSLVYLRSRSRNTLDRVFLISFLTLLGVVLLTGLAAE